MKSRTGPAQAARIPRCGPDQLAVLAPEPEPAHVDVVEQLVPGRQELVLPHLRVVQRVRREHGHVVAVPPDEALRQLLDDGLRAANRREVVLDEMKYFHDDRDGAPTLSFAEHDVSLLDRIYARSPVVVQNAMATGYGDPPAHAAQRRRVPEYFGELDAQQWWSARRACHAPGCRAAPHGRFAATNVPYYRELFAARSIRPDGHPDAPPTSASAFLDKGIVQREGARLRPDRVAVPAIAQTTGGTTGRPVPYFTIARVHPVQLRDATRRGSGRGPESSSATAWSASTASRSCR